MSSYIYDVARWALLEDKDLLREQAPRDPTCAHPNLLLIYGYHVPEEMGLSLYVKCHGCGQHGWIAPEVPGQIVLLPVHPRLEVRIEGTLRIIPPAPDRP